MPGDVCDRLSEIIYRKTIKFICFSDFIVYICNAEPETNAFTMETECVIRIPILPLPAAAFAVHIAARRRFSEADGAARLRGRSAGRPGRIRYKPMNHNHLK